MPACATLALFKKKKYSASLPGDMLCIIEYVDKMPYNVLLGYIRGAFGCNLDGHTVFHYVASEVH